MNKFEEGKYYVMSGNGQKWSDYDGPFANQDEAVSHMKLFINKDHTYSPEMLRMVITHFKSNQLELVKINGVPYNGEYLYWQLNDEDE